MKTCVTCGETKPLTEFVPRKGARDGYRGTCRVCHRERSRLASQRWRERHPEKVKKAFAEWLEKNRDYDRERCNRYDAANREKRRQAIAESRKANPEHHRALRKAWREANLELSRERCRRYWQRLREGAAPADLMTALVAALRQEPCAYCGTTDKVGIDHVIPLSRGGTHVPENIVPACGRCNSSKGAKLLHEWSGPPIY